MASTGTALLALPFYSQISVERVISFPNQLVTTQTNLKQAAGLFPEIGYYWRVNGSLLYLWSYKLRSDLVLPNDFSQQIIHVHLATAVKGVFDEAVTVGLSLTAYV